MKVEFKDKNLPAILEKIVLDKVELAELKEFIVKFTTGEIDSIKLKQYILHSRIRIINDLTEFFPFYLKKIQIKDESYNYNGKAEYVNTEKAGLLEQIKERDDLLNNFIPRIKFLEKSIELSPQMLPPCLLNGEENTKDELLKLLKSMNIEQWLLVFLTDDDGSVIRNDYQFFQNFITIIKRYHDESLDFSHTKDINTLERIEGLDFPQKLKDSLIKVLTIRNKISHNFYKLNAEEIEFVYITYFQMILDLFLKKFNQKKLNINREQINFFLKNFVRKKFSNDTFITRIAYKVIDDNF